MSKVKLTPKQRVLRKWPNAYSHSWACSWVIYNGLSANEDIGEGKTAALAWANAAKGLKP